MGEIPPPNVEAGDRVVTPTQVDEMAKINRLRPTRDDLRRKKGYYEGVGPDGREFWGWKFKPNDHGKPTKEFMESVEMLRPFQRADAERHMRNSRAMPQATLKDKDGHVHHVDPALAAQTARRNGWCHHWRAGGATVERGVDGMLFRRTPHGWEATGRTCLGTPILGGSGRAPTDRLQHDPDGDLWECVAGRWVNLVRDYHASDDEAGTGRCAGDDAARSEGEANHA